MAQSKRTRTLRRAEFQAGRYASVALPIAGAVAFGTAGAAGGTVVAAGINRYTGAAGARAEGKHGGEARAKGRLYERRALVTGGVITGVTAGASALTGSGLTGSPLSALGGAGTAVKPGAAGKDIVGGDEGFLKDLESSRSIFDRTISAPGQVASAGSIFAGLGLPDITPSSTELPEGEYEPGDTVGLPPPPAESSMFGIPKPVLIGGAVVVGLVVVLVLAKPAGRKAP